MNIILKTLTGKCKSINLRVDGSNKVEDVKNMIESIEGIPTDEQRLIYAGKKLENALALSECNVQNESTIHLVFGLRVGYEIFVKMKSDKKFRLHVEGTYTFQKIK